MSQLYLNGSYRKERKCPALDKFVKYLSDHPNATLAIRVKDELKTIESGQLLFDHLVRQLAPYLSNITDFTDKTLAEIKGKITVFFQSL